MDDFYGGSCKDIVVNGMTLTIKKLSLDDTLKTQNSKENATIDLYLSAITAIKDGNGAAVPVNAETIRKFSISTCQKITNEINKFNTLTEDEIKN